MRFQSENRVFRFLQHNVDEAKSKKVTCFKYIVCGFRKLTAVSYSVQGSNTSMLCLKTSFQVF